MEDPDYIYVDITSDNLFEPQFIIICEKNVFFYFFYKLKESHTSKN